MSAPSVNKVSKIPKEELIQDATSVKFGRKFVRQDAKVNVLDDVKKQSMNINDVVGMIHGEKK